MSKQHTSKRDAVLKSSFIPLLILLIMTFGSTICSGQMLFSYKYGKVADTEKISQQTEHIISLGGGQRIKKLGGIMYMDLSLSIGKFFYHQENNPDAKTAYQKGTLSLDLEYSFFCKRFQPLVGITAGLTGAGLKANPDVVVSYLTGGPIAGVRLYLTKTIAIDGTYRQNYYFSRQEGAIDLNPSKLISLGLKIGLFTK